MRNRVKSYFIIPSKLFKKKSKVITLLVLFSFFLATWELIWGYFDWFNLITSGLSSMSFKYLQLRYYNEFFRVFSLGNDKIIFDLKDDHVLQISVRNHHNLPTPPLKSPYSWHTLDKDNNFKSICPLWTFAENFVKINQDVVMIWRFINISFNRVGKSW